MKMFFKKCLLNDLNVALILCVYGCMVEGMRTCVCVWPEFVFVLRFLFIFMCMSVVHHVHIVPTEARRRILFF